MYYHENVFVHYRYYKLNVCGGSWPIPLAQCGPALRNARRSWCAATGLIKIYRRLVDTSVRDGHYPGCGRAALRTHCYG